MLVKVARKERDQYLAFFFLRIIVASNRLFQAVDLHWRVPESGVVWYKSRQSKKMI